VSEPEDLILDGAYVASRFARDLWRRYAPPASDDRLRLAAVRPRLELFLHALFEREIPVSAAEPAAPVSWLARLAGRGAEARADVIPATDGVRVYLPPALDVAPDAGALQLFTLLAVEQAVRLVRGSPAVAATIDRDEVRHRFAIAEASAVDGWIVQEAPGLVPVLRSVRRQALAARPLTWPAAKRGRWIEELLRDWLALDPLERCEWMPVCPTPAASLAWSMAAASGAASDADRFARQVGTVFYWGQFLPPAQVVTARSYADGAEPSAQQKQRRVAEMRRRPRIREAADDEDDAGSGTWVIRPDEPQESVEDPFGLQRPTDRDDHADPEGLGDSLSDLPEARVVRTPGQAREVLRAGDEPQRPPAPAASTPTRPGIAYPEWDYRSRTYRRPGATVREVAPALGDREWVQGARSRHGSLVRRVRTRFERLRPRRVRVGRQPDGPELDIAEYVKSAADLRAGGSIEDRLYVEMRHARRELSVALLVDTSASTDAWVSGSQRIVDVEKDALLVVIEALAALGDRHAIYAFSGQGPEHVAIFPVKRFTEAHGEDVIRRVAELDADGYTRVGAAIRHVTAALSEERSERRLLLLLSDGKPNDVDEYEGRYGIEDARQSVAEARAQNVDVFCLTVDREAPRYAARVFGPAGFTVLRRPDQLPEVLIEALRRLVRPRA
jgi:nitric oxide reductase NorD protein